jgi:hypothetical protein
LASVGFTGWTSKAKRLRGKLAEAAPLVQPWS